MSVAILASRAQVGTDAPAVTIEVFLSGGLPSFSIVGMAETAVRESKHRVRGAIISSGFAFPRERITVSLAPADMKKTGGRFDLAIALGILVASKAVSETSLCRVEFYGELALNGDIRPVPGILPAALKAKEASNSVIVPLENGDEAALARTTVRTAGSLLEVSAHLNAGWNKEDQIRPVLKSVPVSRSTDGPDLRDVKGQSMAKRALEIAAAGGHNLLLIGPPGTGKSMLAQRLPGILPRMSDAETLETAAVESVLGNPLDLSKWGERPFRAPHHTASAAALVGGGPVPKPGEVSRAHNGVLFLDELPEFNRNVLEVLREPLEAGNITISRAALQCDFPARFQLIAAMNPCPCGYYGDPRGNCSCSGDRVDAYRGKVSGPLLDRIDLQVNVERLRRFVLNGKESNGESSATVAKRVSTAQQLAFERNGVCNAAMSVDDVERCCVLSSSEHELLEQAVEKMGLSMRGYHRTLRVARTVADLASENRIDTTHLAEALSFRQW